MRWHLPVLMFCAWFLREPALAQDVGQGPLDPQPVISDLNAIASRLANQKKLSNEDVMQIVSIACSTMRVAVREKFSYRVGPVLREKYPPEEKLFAINKDEFIAVETEYLKKYGASGEAVGLVMDDLKKNLDFPPHPPADDRQLDERFRTLESVSCGLRAKTLSNPAGEASPAAGALAWSIGKGIVGLALIVIDTNITIDTGGLTAAIIGVVSCGWGWGRAEEAFGEVESAVRTVFE